MTINFVGRLGRDAERHDGKNGSSFVTFNVAVNEYNPETKQNDTVWLRVIDGSERTLNMLQYLKKGTMLNIVGSERVSIYNGANGPTINRDVRVFNWEFVSSGKQDTDNTQQVTQTQSVPTVTVTETITPQQVATTGTFVQPSVVATDNVSNTDDDLPF